MALVKWAIHSACHVLGYPNPNPNQNNKAVQYSSHDQVKKSFKVEPNCAELNDFHSGTFQMPLHYPRYTKADYDKMEEWKVDRLLKEYGLNFKGTLQEKRAFAIGAFLWPDQY
ncbi:Cytoplasmic tRNA 2-thiolation protein 1 [Quillaja saponaria]|uniref:Cytoplasmic tRNA 2-thiolation protein 1 n=1 Tax=Quillaja saponaria TaxID=32244 RepID=A0AAD7KWJ4_QUISA|nr:Cytoplasmic tRNA 2-thiolation protein 1 [Quillaja saponaria]